MNNKLPVFPLFTAPTEPVSMGSEQIVAVVDSAIDLLQRHEQSDTTGDIMEARFLLELLADLIEQQNDA